MFIGQSYQFITFLNFLHLFDISHSNWETPPPHFSRLPWIRRGSINYDTSNYILEKFLTLDDWQKLKFYLFIYIILFLLS